MTDHHADAGQSSRAGPPAFFTLFSFLREREGVSIVAKKRTAVRKPTRKVSQEPGDTIGTGYAVVAFPVREEYQHDWGAALYDAKLRGSLALSSCVRRGERLPGGIVVGLDPMMVDDSGEWEAVIAAMPSQDIYGRELSTERPDVSERVSLDRLGISEREEADLSLAWLTKHVYEEEIIGLFLAVATSAAVAVARVLASDIVREAKDAEDIGRRLLAQGIPSIANTTARQRRELMRTHTATFRYLLRSSLFDSEELIATIAKKVGRPPETLRNHKAYCMREFLKKDPSSEFAHMKPRPRANEAMAKVCEMHLGAASIGKWKDAMSQGKRIARKMHPQSPYCRIFMD